MPLLSLFLFGINSDSKSKSSSIPDDITADEFNYYFSAVGNNIGSIVDDNVIFSS